MEIKIGENIKRLRKEKGVTQEKLAEVFNISSVAVSKWEIGETYPDISLLFSIANYFKVSIDELMGYNENLIEKDILCILNEYDNMDPKLKWNGNCKLIVDAKKKYSYDYRIVHRYMFEKALGFADNNLEVLKNNCVELLSCCNMVLDNATTENYRVDALTLKAKILYATNKESEALDIINSFPSLYHTVNQRKEQLYNKGSNEYYLTVNDNIIELMHLLGDKLAKSIIYNTNLSMDDKINEIKLMIDSFKKVNNIKYFNELYKVFNRRILNHPEPKLNMPDELVKSIENEIKQF